MTTATVDSFRRDAQVISLVGLAHGTSHFFHLSLAPLFPWLKDAFAVSYAELGLLMSVFFIVSGVGQALAGPVLGRRALVAGALASMAPDLDMLAIGSGPYAEWIWHRSYTHSLWFGPVVGTLAGYALWRWLGGPLRTWMALAVLALLAHPLLDLVTSYGTQLLAPFSHRRFALGAVAIIDPAYSLVLAAGILVGLRAGLATAASTRAARQVLAVSTLYLALGLWVNARVEAEARAQLRAQGVEAAEVTAYPTLLQLPFRRIVARSGDTVRVGWLSALRPRPIQWESFTQASGPLVEAARATPEVRVFEWFAMGEATPRVAAAPEGGSANRAVIALVAQRFGAPRSAIEIGPKAPTRRLRVPSPWIPRVASARITTIDQSPELAVHVSRAGAPSALASQNVTVPGEAGSSTVGVPSTRSVASPPIGRSWTTRSTAASAR